jgi:hypothetical protein
MPVTTDLVDWQYDLAGALMGAGTSVNVIEVTGLGRPPVRDNDTPQPSADGVFPGPDYWDGRQVQFDAAIKTVGDPAAAHDVLGFTAPVAAPIYVSAASGAADRPGWVVNSGNTPTYPVIRITGPCSNVTVVHAESGRVLQLPTLSLTAGQWVELDARPGRVSVVDQNGGNAESYLSAASRLDLFTLPPGQSELRWTATDPTNTSRLRLTWRDAYTAL